jgi:hypothetical protein
MAGNKVNYDRNPNHRRIFPLLRLVDGSVTARARFPFWRINSFAQNCFGRSSYFLIACKNGDLRVAKVLLEMGANVAAKNQYGITALMHACGTSMIGKNEYGITALMHACGTSMIGSRSGPMVAWLLEQRGVCASMDDADDNQNTALHYAIMDRNHVNVEIVRMLLCYGVDRTCRNHWNKTAAEELRSCGSIVLAKLIEDWKEPEIEEWRPWNAKRAPAKYRGALRSLLVLAKASVKG